MESMVGRFIITLQGTSKRQTKLFDMILSTIDGEVILKRFERVFGTNQNWLSQNFEVSYPTLVRNNVNISSFKKLQKLKK